jgi:thiol:disulfide interchange protein DsbD
MVTIPPAPAISLWQALGLALLGGLILNLMPCVFPVLSMKALSLVKMSNREQSHAVVHGLAYTAGILVCFGVIAAILIALQQTGQQIGWGFQLQSPIVVLLLAYLLFLIGLNLSGVFEVGSASLTNIGSRLSQRQGYTGSFFTGMLATVVATPCTAPFMGAAMGYALTQPPTAALGVFMALGLGLALPYLLLAGIPAFRRALPHPGAWMETFRQFLAFPMYASVAWLVWVYGQQVEGAYAILLAGLGIVFIAMGVWIWKKAPLRHPANALVKVVSVMCFGAALAIAALSIMRAPFVASSAVADQPVQHSGNWTPFTQDQLDTALKGNDPVFVNMTASWCITCKVNERVALAVDSTQDLFKEKKILYLVGDWTNQNPEITAYLGTHGRSGVPLYVFYGSRDPTTNARPEPVVLPQLLTPGLIADVVTYN